MTRRRYRPNTTDVVALARKRGYLFLQGTADTYSDVAMDYYDATCRDRVPTIFITQPRRYAAVEWEAGSMNPDGPYPEPAPFAREVIRRAFEDLTTESKSTAKEVTFQGSAGTAKGMEPDDARAFADWLFALLSDPDTCVVSKNLFGEGDAA